MTHGTSRLRVRALGLLLLVLVAGAVLGAAVTTWRLTAPPPPEPVDGIAVSVDGDPFERLDLSSAQSASIDSILADMSEVTDSLLASSRQALVGEAKQAEAGIRAILTPAQTARFDSLLADLGGLRVKVARRMIASDTADGGEASTP